MSLKDGFISKLPTVMALLIIIWTWWLISFIFQLCWNYVMPFVFGLPWIGFWHSVVILGMISLIGGLFTISYR